MFPDAGHTAGVSRHIELRRIEPLQSWKVVRSGNNGRSARLRVGSRRRSMQCRRLFEPDDNCRRARQLAERGLRIGGRRRGMRRATNQATVAVRLLLIGLAALRRGCIGEVRTDRAGKRIRQRVGCSPAGCDRCKDLHQYRQHDDWKESSQPPSHDRPPFALPAITLRVGSRDQVPG